MRSLRRAFSFAAVVAISGCGGGGGGGGITPAGPTSSLTAPEAISFFIPAASSPAARTKTLRPNYLPASTQSVVAAFGAPINSTVTPVTLVLNSSSCTPVSGGVQCSGTANLVAGATYTFTVNAYSGTNGTGVPLASTYGTVTVVSGGGSLNVALGNSNFYTSVGASGQVNSLKADHQNNIWTRTNISTGTGSSGTLAALPNGFEKLTVTAATDSTPVGSIAYVRESPGGLSMALAEGTSPPVTAQASGNVDAVFAVNQELCPSSITYPVNVISYTAGGFQASYTSATAFATGSFSISGSSVTANGTNYLYNGTSAGSTGGSLTGCSNGVFGSQSSGYFAMDQQGFFIGASGNPSNTNATVGFYGFPAPSQNVPISTLTSFTYDAITVGQVTISGTTTTAVNPTVATPSGSNAFQTCNYSNFESNVLNSTGCGSVTLTGQPFPGIVSGTYMQGTTTASFYAAVGQVNGKYALATFSVQTSSGTGQYQPINLLFLQR